jgi:hypothetical protein
MYKCYISGELCPQVTEDRTRTCTEEEADYCEQERIRNNPRGMCFNNCDSCSWSRECLEVNRTWMT